MELNNKVTKCYNSVSCLLSVAIIVFVLSAIAYDLIVSKPQIRKDINEIRLEITEINNKMDVFNTPIINFKDSLSTNEAK